MADGVNYTEPGSGTKFLTDDTGGTGHAQVIKIAISANGDATLIPADATYGLDVDVTRSIAAARTTDSVAAAAVTDAVMQNLTARTPAFAIIDAATSGDNTLLAAQGASNKIRVLAAWMVASAAVTARFESGAGGTALTGQMQLGANGGFVLPFNPVGWFETAANTLLNLELSGAVSVDGGFVYIVVT